MEKPTIHKSTAENLKRLACIAYYSDNRGETTINMIHLQAAGIGDVSDEDILKNNKTKYETLRRYKDKMKAAGFITCLSNSYQVGVRSKPYRVEKENIVNAYGMEVVKAHRETYAAYFWKRNTPEAFAERFGLMSLEAPPMPQVKWELTSPGCITFTEGRKKPKVIRYQNEFGTQRFTRKAFYYDKEAIVAFVLSLRERHAQIEEEVEEQLRFINEGISGEFRVDFHIRRSAKWSQDYSAFTIKKSTRAHSPFCNYQKANGARARLCARERLTQQFDIRSAVPRIAYYVNQWGVWLPDAIDLYQKIYVESGLPWEFTSEVRDHLKGAFMTMYFKDLVQQSWIAYLRNHDPKVKNRKTGLTNAEKNGPAMFSWDEFQDLFYATRRVLGPSKGSEIFFIESLLELDTVHHFRKLGHKIANVYDCFFFGDTLTAEEVQAYLPIAAKNAHNRYLP